MRRISQWVQTDVNGVMDCVVAVICQELVRLLLVSIVSTNLFPCNHGDQRADCRFFPSLIAWLGFLACCCPCIVYGRNKNRVEYMNANGQPDPDHGGGCCSSNCALDCLLIHFGFNWLLPVRRCHPPSAFAYVTFLFLFPFV